MYDNPECMHLSTELLDGIVNTGNLCLLSDSGGGGEWELSCLFPSFPLTKRGGTKQVYQPEPIKGNHCAESELFSARTTVHNSIIPRI